MGDLAVVASGVGKQFSIGPARARHNTLRDAVAAAAGRLRSPLQSRRERRESNRFWALRDVSFDLNRGEVLGIIGRNGAGKSTLLKILSRITEPTTGELAVRGRVGALLEVGTGFHSELTGRENIFLNGAILGMTRVEIARKFDEIVAFAEVERFIDTPVKHYSSGMYLRLGFAVAAHLEPEVLIVDEVLAVGDVDFQRKCLGRMGDVAREGRTVIFVSHNLDAIQRLCGRCILLERGRVLSDGDTGSVVAGYLANRSGGTPPGRSVNLDEVARTGSGEVRFRSASYTGGGPGTDRVARSGDPLRVNLSLEAQTARVVESLAISIRSRDGQLLVNADAMVLGEPVRLDPGTNTLAFQIEALYLNPGYYLVSLWAGDAVATVYDYVEHAFELEVADDVLPRYGAIPARNGTVFCRFGVIQHAPTPDSLPMG